MTFVDRFSEQSGQYAAAPPTYPEALFAAIAVAAPVRSRAWDCATGSGQAAVGLATHFANVEATDVSAQQVANAMAHPRVRCEPVALPPLEIEMAWTLRQYLDYVETWSATRAYIAELGRAVMDETESAMRKVWGEPEVRSVTMPLHVRCGRHVDQPRQEVMDALGKSLAEHDALYRKLAK